MIPLNRILMPTDFSDLAALALRYARELAKTYRAQLHVLHVASLTDCIPLPSGSAPELGINPAVPAEAVQIVVQRQSARLEACMREYVTDQPVEPVSVVRAGVAWEEIARYAVESDIDLIVIGTHARGMMNRLMLGSVGKAVLEHSHCPVLMVPVTAMQRPAAVAD